MDVLLYMILPWVGLYYAMMAVVGVCNGIKWVWMERLGGRRRKEAAIQRGWDNLPEWFARRRARREADEARVAAQRAVAQRIKSNIVRVFQ